MANIFVSYAREDAGVVEELASALQTAGHTVWWDRQIKGGRQYSREIEAELNRADKVIVLWSRDSVESPWVRDEAATARDSERLVPISLDGTQAPLGFRQFQTIDLKTSTRRHSEGFDLVLNAIRDETPTAAIELRRGSIHKGLFARASGSGGTRGHVLRLMGVAAIALGLLVAVLFSGGLDRLSGSKPLSVAVLPFEAIPADAQNTPFAEGVSEEILGELARNPRLQLVGRTSAATFRNSEADARAIGRKLRATYLLDGTVRRSGNEVRVAVELVRASDGVQVWRQAYDGSLDDIFAIQERIGRAVEGQLRVTFAGKEGVTAQSLATRGDVYALYLTARDLIRNGEPSEAATAIAMLRKALTMDPNYAPAWAMLSVGIRERSDWSGSSTDSREDIRARQLARAYADRALTLAPQLAIAHIAKAKSLGFSEQALRHLQSATRIDQNDAQTWFELGVYHDWRGDFMPALEAYRRAVDIEPLWWLAYYSAAESAWMLGFEEESRRYLEYVGREGDAASAHIERGSMAGREGNLSEQVKEGLAAKASADPSRRIFADFTIWAALRTAGYVDEARFNSRFYHIDEALWNLWRGIPPDRAEIARRFADPKKGWSDWEFARPLLKSLVNKGRANEVVSLYRAQFGSPRALLSHPRGHIATLEDGTSIAVALQDVGQIEEARDLLATLRKSADSHLRAGRVPRHYHLYVAMIAGAQQDRMTALRELETLGALKWHYGGGTDIADEPAFRSLKGDPRFEAIAARHRAWKARERREIAPMLAQLGAS